jgi:hypothetical protein
MPGRCVQMLLMSLVLLPPSARAQTDNKPAEVPGQDADLLHARGRVWCGSPTSMRPAGLIRPIARRLKPFAFLDKTA